MAVRSPNSGQRNNENRKSIIGEELLSSNFHSGVSLTVALTYLPYHGSSMKDGEREVQ